jgi:hypothetical protein
MATLKDYRSTLIRNSKSAGDDYPIYCLGKTAKGAPRHPLYLRNDQPLEVYA